MAFPNPFNRVWMDTAMEKRPTRPALKQQYIGLEFFPYKRVYDYQLTWDLIKSGNRQAGIYAHDGVPIAGQGYDYESMIADIMHIMASRTVSPDVVMKLRDAGETSVHSNLVKGMRQKLLGKVAEGTFQCQDEVEATIEYLCMQALTGTIVWPPVDGAGAAISQPPASWGDISFSLSLGYRATFVQAATTLVGWNSRPGGQVAWSTPATATPRKDLEVIGQLIQETTGLTPWGATVIMSRTMLSYLAENAELLEWFRHSSGGPALDYLDINNVKTALQTRLGWNIRLYDAIWTYPSGLASTSGVTENQVRFLNRKHVIIIPQGATDGNYFATAPDLGAPNGESLGLYSWMWQEEKPPWTTELGCGLHGFPIPRSTQEMFLLDALN